MRRALFLAIAAGCCAAACARQSSPSEQRANTPRIVTLIGCIERGGKDGGVVLRGRDVTGTTGTGVGQEAGGLPSTETMPAGDEDRNVRPATTMEARASTLTPRLESNDRTGLESRIGQRVLVRGEFEPAGMERPDDTLKVSSVETIGTSCNQ
jgi:hypothetical protein